MNVIEKKYERRLYSPSSESRLTRAYVDEKTNKRYIEGTAVEYGKESLLLNESGMIFKEIIERGAFDKALQAEDLNVLATVNHDQHTPLARTKNGSLTLTSDDHGLHYRFEVPNTTAGNDCYENVRSGLFRESSFVYTVSGEGHEVVRRNNQNYHIVRSANALYDISVVTDGCFGANTNVEISERLMKRALEMGDKVEADDAKEQGASKIEFQNQNLSLLITSLD